MYSSLLLLLLLLLLETIYVTQSNLSTSWRDLEISRIVGPPSSSSAVSNTLLPVFDTWRLTGTSGGSALFCCRLLLLLLPEEDCVPLEEFSARRPKEPPSETTRRPSDAARFRLELMLAWLERRDRILAAML